MGLKLDRAREIVTKFPGVSKKELGKLLVKAHPKLYGTAEEARTYVRTATGANGKLKRKDHPIKVPLELAYNPYQLEKEEHNRHVNHVLRPTKDTVIGLLSDLHLPYQHNQALTVALDHCRRIKVTHLVLNGDVLDAYELSRFEKDPAKRDFKAELYAVRRFLEVLVAKFPKTKIIFKEGNHEARVVRFMKQRAPELLGFEVFNLRNLLGLNTGSLLVDDRGDHLPALPIDHVPDHRLIECGKLMIIHGHEFGQAIFSPVNPARGFFLKAKTNVIGGHHHQVSSHSENRLDGDQIVAYSTGHLADEHPEYRPINNWSLGFATIRFRETKKGQTNFIVHNHKVIDGEIY